MGKAIVKLRTQLIERCKGYCEMCGASLPEDWAMHHRQLKSRGGKDELSNLIAVHHGCHNLDTKSIHLNPAWSAKFGFMVSAWQHPEQTPIFYMLNDSVCLMNDGSIVQQTRKEKELWQENLRSPLSED